MTGRYRDIVQLYCDYGHVNGDYTATQLICPTERQLVLVNTCYNDIQLYIRKIAQFDTGKLYMYTRTFAKIQAKSKKISDTLITAE